MAWHGRIFWRPWMDRRIASRGRAVRDPCGGRQQRGSPVRKISRPAAVKSGIRLAVMADGWQQLPPPRPASKGFAGLGCPAAARRSVPLAIPVTRQLRTWPYRVHDANKWGRQDPHAGSSSTAPSWAPVWPSTGAIPVLYAVRPRPTRPLVYVLRLPPSY